MWFKKLINILKVSVYDGLTKEEGEEIADFLEVFNNDKDSIFFGKLEARILFFRTLK